MCIRDSVVGGSTITVSERTIVQNTYNEMGQLINKKIGTTPGTSNELESLTYDYNIRGWTLGANKNFLASGTGNYFGFELGYDKPAGTAGNYTVPEYNGNISGTSWKSKGDGELRRYDFTYDNVNRLTGADFNQFTSGSFNKTANVDFSVSNLDYDANGNIQHMNQKGLKVNASSYIDQMSYNYIANSNKLLNVIDASNEATTTLGDFRASTLYQQTVPNKTTSTDDYTYDVNGNLVKDYNKDIGSTSTNGIAYNYLNLPQNISVTNKGSIEYVYDASGNKLKKIVHENNKPDKVTDYINGFIYEDNVLQFFSQEEGRIRFKPVAGNNAANLVFDYFLKDHLGNVRMVLTEEEQPDMYPAATMETTASTTEETFYSNLPATRVDAPTSNGYPSNTPSGNVKVAKVNGGGNKIGPAIVLKVMAGDKFNIIVNSWYKTNGSPPGTSTGILTTLLGALSNGVGGLAGGKVTASDLQNANAFNNGANQFLNNQNSGNNGTRPKAYLNWILFDEQFNLVSNSSGFEQVPAESVYGDGSTGSSLYTHVKSNMPIDKNGFLYIYVSNETPNIDVFFDNLQVTHTRGPILEETHYYPFGLAMAGISSKAVGKLENKTKYDGYELNSDFDINLYESFYRLHDPQIGRFWQLDSSPTDFESLYAAMGNNPISHFDLLGDTLAFPGASSAFLEQFNEAGTLLEAKGVGDLLQKAKEMKGTVNVVEGEEGSVNSYDPNTGTLYWNPNTALETDKGVKLSPTAILNHELDHAVQDGTHHVQYTKENNNKTGKDKQYDTKEERRVITGSEQRTARALGLIKKGQVTRTNHNKGTLYPTTGVASTSNRTIEQIKKMRNDLKKAKAGQKKN